MTAEIDTALFQKIKQENYVSPQTNKLNDFREGITKIGTKYSNIM